MQISVSAKNRLTVILGLAFVIRLILILTIQPDLTSDYLTYHRFATLISQGAGYVSGTNPTAYYPVGYPALLGMLYKIFGPSQMVGLIGNAVMATGIIWCSFILANGVFKNEKVALWGATALAVYPTFFMHTFLMGSEIPFTFFVSLALVFFEGAKDRISCFVLSGICFGISCLIRSESLFLPGFIFGFLALIKLLRAEKGTPKALVAIGKKALMGAIVTYVAMLAVVLPWSFRNYKVFGKFVLVSTNGGVNFFAASNPSANGTDYIDPEVLKGLDRTGSETDIDREYFRAGMEYFKANPFRYFAQMPFRFWHLLKPHSISKKWLDGSNPVKSIFSSESLLNLSRVVFWTEVLTYCLLVLAFLRFFFWMIRQKMSAQEPTFYLPFIVIAYFIAIHLFFSCAPRYAFPILPWFVMCATFALISDSLGSKFENAE